MNRGLDVMVANLFTAFGKPLDEDAMALYERSLAEVPLPLVDAAVARAIRTRNFLPRIAELLQDAETCRQELSQRIPFAPCLACRDRRPGWMTVIDPDGVSREARCDCWHKHQARLAGHGITGVPIVAPALPPASEDV